MQISYHATSSSDENKCCSRVNWSTSSACWSDSRRWTTWRRPYSPPSASAIDRSSKWSSACSPTLLSTNAVVCRRDKTSEWVQKLRIFTAFEVLLLKFEVISRMLTVQEFKPSCIFIKKIYNHVRVVLGLPPSHLMWHPFCSPATWTISPSSNGKQRSSEFQSEIFF